MGNTDPPTHPLARIPGRKDHMTITPHETPHPSDMSPEQLSRHLQANHPESMTIGDHARFHAAFDGLLAHVHVGETGRWADEWDASYEYRQPDDAPRMHVAALRAEAEAGRQRALDLADAGDRAYDRAEAHMLEHGE